MESKLNQWLKENIEHGNDCPCCGSRVKVYRRKATRTMIEGLAQLMYLTKTEEKEYFTIKELSDKRLGDFSKLRYWKLIEMKKGKNGRGKWRITGKGKMFINNEMHIKKYALVYVGEVVGYEGELLTIKELY